MFLERISCEAVVILFCSSLFCIKKEFLLEGRHVFLVKLIISESITLFVTFECLCFVLLRATCNQAVVLTCCAALY